MIKNKLRTIRYFSFFIAFLLISSNFISIIAQDTLKGIEWSTEWSDGDHQIIDSDMHGNNNNLYTICSASNGSDCISFLIKWDRMGNQIWNRIISDVSLLSDCFIWSDEDNCYTLFGNFLIRWDNNGNQIWKRTIFEDGSILPWELSGDTTGIYTLVEHYNTTHTTLSFMKFDFNKSLILQKDFFDISRGNLWISENAIYVSYKCFNDNLGLIKWDKTGLLVWNKTYDFDTLGFSITRDYNLLGNSSYLYCGGINYETNKLYLIKLDESGTLHWTSNLSLSGTVHLEDIWVYNDDIYLSGYRTDDQDGCAAVYSFMLKYNSTGALQWNKSDFMIATSFWSKDLNFYLCGHDFNKLKLAKWDPSVDDKTSGLSNHKIIISMIIIFLSFSYLIKKKKK